jgi:hypothetical protein
MALTAGTRLGPYEILAPIGAGGMGEVYRARDSRLGRDVAIKVLPEHLANDPTALIRFEHEAKAVAALAHPNILVLYDVGLSDGTRYAVTELLEGQTLRERLSRERLPWRKAAEVGAAVADGLAAAHSKEIVHRDIKPGNIFRVQPILRVARYPPAASQIATAKTSVNAGRHRRTYRQEPGHKGGVGGALKEARHRRREDAPGVAQLAYQQSFQV